MQKVSLFIAGIATFVTAVGHAVVGQVHLNRILSTSIETIDSAVVFAVWHMVTIFLLATAVGNVLFALCKQTSIVRVYSLIVAVIYCLFGLVFLATSFLFSEPTIQWIPMLVISLFLLIGYICAGKSSEY